MSKDSSAARRTHQPRRWRAATVASVGALLLGSAVALAPSASAVGTSACSPYRGVQEMLHTTSSSVNLRTGPSTKYTSLGLLSKRTNFWYICHKDTGPGAWNWTYGTVMSGSHRGQKGWVFSKYLAGGAA